MVPRKKIFKVFYHIWAWQPSWSCDLQNVDKFSLIKYKNSSFKSSENIQKKECGPDRSVSDNLYLQAYIQNLVEWFLRKES